MTDRKAKAMLWQIAVLVTPLLVCSTGAGADFAGGNGTLDDPYRIATAPQLISIGSDPSLLSKHFVLVADIDLDPNLPGGRVFDRAVIAPDMDEKRGEFQGSRFMGSLDGKGYAIKRLLIRSSHTFLGLFGEIGLGGEVYNLGLRDVSIKTQTSQFVAALAASNRGGLYRQMLFDRERHRWQLL